jgi:hypothetical protein
MLQSGSERRKRKISDGVRQLRHNQSDQRKTSNKISNIKCSFYIHYIDISLTPPSEMDLYPSPNNHIIRFKNIQEEWDELACNIDGSDETHTT